MTDLDDLVARLKASPLIAEAEADAIRCAITASLAAEQMVRAGHAKKHGQAKKHFDALVVSIDEFLAACAKVRKP